MRIKPFLFDFFFKFDKCWLIMYIIMALWFRLLFPIWSLWNPCSKLQSVTYGFFSFLNWSTMLSFGLMLMNCVELSDMCRWGVVLLLYHLVFLHKISQYLVSPSENVIVCEDDWMKEIFNLGTLPFCMQIVFS